MQQLTLEKLNKYNLFNKEENKLLLRALFISKRKIEIIFKENIQKGIKIELFNHFNIKINSFELVFSEEKNKLFLKGKFNINVNYYLKFKNEFVHVIYNPEINGILDTNFFTNEDDFGVKINKNNTASFKLWSPPAVKVELLLFNRNQERLKLQKALFFKKTYSGIWEFTLNPKEVGLLILDGIYYQYKITAYGKERIALDPYAKSMAVFSNTSDDNVGKGVIMSVNSGRAYPSRFKKHYSNFKHIENETDIITYEVNIRDFSIQPGYVKNKIAGTFKALTKNVEYLKKLGITHVQLMPINKAYTQNELEKRYTGKSAKKSNYNWGYDPMNYFTIEGRYSTNPYKPYNRVVEFREMVQEFHNSGIGVILDVVFNHTFIADTFENIAPGCYYRHTENYNISGRTGAGATLESRRKQVRKFIIDVLKFFLKEYHIDGFRFDLMSFHDKETMKQIRNEVGLAYNPENKNELILQGEAWNFTDLKKDAVVKTDFESKNIAIFNDTFRDALAGNGEKHGFIHGNATETSRLASAIVAGVNSFDNEKLPFNKDIFFNSYNLFAEEPTDCLNFISVHDGFTLWDKLNLTIKDKSKKERLRLMKFAYSILLSSQGKIILHGGDEILRSKALSDFDKEKHRAHTSDNIDTELDTTFFHENSYSSNDYTNMFRWDRLTNEYAEFANELLEFVKGLIKMRRNISAFRFNNKEDICKNITFIDNAYSEKNTIHSFKSRNLKKLTLKFKNGIAGEKYYLCGEIHKNEANPTNNYYVLQFNKTGSSTITFNKNEIKNFNIQKWDNSRNINFKLVKTAGKWDFNKTQYSDFGYNSISPESVNENFEAEIDLSKKDFKDIKANNFVEKNYIAYIIDNEIIKKDNKNYFQKILVIHNAGNESLNFKFSELNPETSYAILDSKNAGNTKLLKSDIEIKKGQIIIPRKCTAIAVI